MASETLNRQNNFPKLTTKTATLFSGLIAGLVSRTAVAPFERVIIIRQTNLSEYSGQKSTMTLLRNIFNREGMLGLFRGNWANCARMAPNTAIEFYTFDLLKKKFADWDFISEKPRYLLAGSISGVCAYSATFPIDVVRTLHSLGKHTDKGIFRTILHLARQEGVARLYRGLGVTCVGIFPFSGIKLASYQVLTNLFYSSESAKRNNNTANFIMGGLAGYVAVTVCYPTDFVRRNRQVASLNGKSQTYGGFIKETFRAGGISAFYKGLAPTYMKIVPATAIAFFVNEHLKNRLIH